MPRLASLQSWISGLPPSVRRAVQGRMRSRLLESGQVVYALGDPGMECFEIRSGRIRLSNYSHAGREVRLVELRQGDSFGEMSLLDGLPRANSAFAASTTELGVLQKRDFDQLSSAHREIAAAINVYLCHRLRTLYARAEEASVLVLKDRLARLVARLASSYGEPDGSGAVVVRAVSHEDLAHMLGASRQSVSRELKELERAGLVELGYRRIRIPDLRVFDERLEPLMGGGPVGSS